MKKIIFYSGVLLSFGILSSCSEKKIAVSEVPQPAMAAFNTKYQGATDVEWETEKEDGKLFMKRSLSLTGKRLKQNLTETALLLKRSKSTKDLLVTIQYKKTTF